MKLKARTERRNWTELTRFRFWRTDLWTSKASPLDGAYCNALLLAHWSLRQKLNRVSSTSVQLSSVLVRCSVGALSDSQHVRGCGRLRRRWPAYSREHVWLADEPVRQTLMMMSACSSSKHTDNIHRCLVGPSYTSTLSAWTTQRCTRRSTKSEASTSHKPWSKCSKYRGKDFLGKLKEELIIHGSMHAMHVS